MLSLQPGHVLFHVPRRPSTGARCDGVRTEMSGVSSDRRPPDGGRDRRSGAKRLHRLSHAQTEIQSDPDQCPHETIRPRSGEHTSELQSPCNIVCRLFLLKKKKQSILTTN